MGRDFYTFAGENNADGSEDIKTEQEMFGLDENGCVPFPARIAIYDDPTMTPRVVIIDPCDIHHYLEEISKNVYTLSNEQGGVFPYSIIREVVENYIHAFFMEPTISIMDKGHTIKFSDRGPGIKNKELAMEIGASSANPQMKRYIRGVGSGLPIVKSYLNEKGGSLQVQDNLSEGTVITISLPFETENNPASFDNNENLAGNNPHYPQQQPFQQPSVTPDPYGQGYPNPQFQQPVANGFPNPYPGYMPAGQPAYTQAPAQPYMQPIYQQPTGTQFNNVQGSDPYQMFAGLNVSDRGKQALMLYTSYSNVGPTECVNMYGGSNPTWSRALSELDGFGLTLKNGQKRHLTDFGKAYLAFLNN